MGIWKKRIFALKMAFAGRRAGAFAAELASHDNWSEERLAEYNWQRRCEMVDYAFENIPFYRKKYSAAGFCAGDLKSEKDFEALPPLEKAEIRACAEEMHPPWYKLSQLGEATTSGSTGEPLKIYRDPNIIQQIMSYRSLNWWGVDISDNSAYIYRNVPHGWRKKMQEVMLLPTRRNWLYAGAMTEDNMLSFYHWMIAHRVRYMVGYVGGIEVFADFLREHGYVLPDLIAVWTTAAPLPESKRKYLSSVLGAKIYSQYGANEFYWIAVDCQEQCGMHIASDVRHVEAVDENNKRMPEGLTGELLVSDLCNRAFPLLRYRLGDRGRLLKEKCACGLPYPMMDYVKGRTSDNIYLKDGGVIPGELPTAWFDSYSSVVKAYQVYQYADGRCDIYYEALPGKAGTAELSAAMQELDNLLLRDFSGRLDFCLMEKHIDCNDNGKSRYVISEIKRQK